MVTAGDDALKHQEKDGITFEIVWNDSSNRATILLFAFKKIIQEQLPNMPRDYISQISFLSFFPLNFLSYVLVRILLDRHHRSVIVTKYKGSTEVLGGICFRPFHSQGFAEIVFLAISESEKSKGLGARVMNHCKEHVKTEDIKYFLTFADNTAIGYFVKQGFKRRTMQKIRWEGFIKEYVRSTLMECRILYTVNYIYLKDIIKQQKQAVLKKMEHISHSDVIYSGLDASKFESGSIPIDQIPGIQETSWHAKCCAVNSQSAKLAFILQQLSKIKAAEPFLQPVDEEHAPNYREIIKHPMDLSTIETKLKNGLYITKEDFCSDFALMIENCRTYNDPSTVYVRYAGILENKFKSFIAQKFPLG